MRNKVEVMKNIRFIIPMVAAGIGVVVACLILFTGINDVVDDKEINNWAWGDFKLAGTCPVAKFPIPVNPKIKEEKEVVGFWNKALSKPVFVVKEGGISTRIATSKHPKFTEYCELVKLGDGSRAEQNWPHTFAWTDFTGRLKRWKIWVYICLEKYHKAIKMMNTPISTKVKLLGLKGLLMHEYGHLLIGPGHPKYADLMSPAQSLTRLHVHTRALIEKTLIEPCSR
jgi:hypothetical protein